MWLKRRTTNWKVETVFRSRRGGGGTPYYGLYWDATAERGTLFRLQVYAKVGNILVEEYERVGKSVISVCKKSQKD